MHHSNKHTQKDTPFLSFIFSVSFPASPSLCLTLSFSSHPFSFSIHFPSLLSPSLTIFFALFLPPTLSVEKRPKSTLEELRNIQVIFGKEKRAL